MNSEQQSVQSIDEQNTQEDINIRDIVNKYTYHWPVFLLGIIVCIGLAFIYLRYTRPVYQISSSLLIKDDKKGVNPADILSQLDIFGGSKVVENEVEILQSKTLMRRVVDRLHLDVTYKNEGRVIDTELYKKRPVTVIMGEANPKFYGLELEMTINGKSGYTIKNPKTGENIKGTFDQLVKSFFGVFTIRTTENFSGSNQRLTITINDPASVADDLLHNLTVAVAGKQSTVLDLSLQHTNLDLAKDILDTLILVYNEASLADKNQITESTIRFIDERLGLISGELTSVEKDVEAFKTSNKLTDITGEASLYLENVKVNDAQLNEVNIKLAAIQDIQRYVNSNSSKEKLPSVFGINDPVLLGQITQLSELQLQRDRLLATTQEDNPLVQPLIKQIETTRSSILSSIQNINSSLMGSKRALESNNSRFEGSIRKIPTQERQFIGIKRQQTIKETLYLYLLQKKEEAALSYASTLADSRIIDQAYSSGQPIKPKKALTYLIALFFGVAIPVGYLYLKELFNNRILSVADISNRTGTPVVGDIIYQEDTEPIVVTAVSRSAISEQFRAIRTNMQFIQGKQINKLGRVTLFTSSMSGEGKSFIASNMAAAFAISGQRTVLLELDLRKPKISKYLNLNNKTGLSNYLIGKAEIENIVKPSIIHENLFTIGSGPIPPNPSELLIQESLDELIQYLKSNFDEVIIDAPPIGLVTDAQILSRLADTTLYIIRHGVTFKEQVSQLNGLYNDHKFPKLNIIFNGVKIGGSYGYGYGYGYYSDDHSHSRKKIKNIIKEISKRF